MRKSELEKRPDMIDEVEKLSADGLPQKFIASKIGITVQSFRKYNSRGSEFVESDRDELSDKDQLYLEFHEAYEKGRAQFVHDIHNEIAWKSEPRTKLTLLATLFPQEYATKTVTDLDDLAWKLRKEYGDEPTDKVLKILLEAIENESR